MSICKSYQLEGYYVTYVDWFLELNISLPAAQLCVIAIGEIFQMNTSNLTSDMSTSTVQLNSCCAFCTQLQGCEELFCLFVYLEHWNTPSCLEPQFSCQVLLIFGPKNGTRWSFLPLPPPFVVQFIFFGNFESEMNKR